MLVVAAARSLPGVSAKFVTPDGSGSSPDLLFRRSPGPIFGAGQRFTHAAIGSSRRLDRLEAHIGIRAAGRSSVMHECDVAVLPARVARACRVGHRHPDYRELELAIEARFVSSGRVPLPYGRTFLGLSHELRQPARLAMVATRDSPDIPRLLRQHHRSFSRFFGDVSADPSARTVQDLFEFVREELRVWAA
jgi:hypothetical protein